MRVLIVGSLAGELGAAARIAMARGARLSQADTVEAALARLREDAACDVAMCDLAHDVGGLVRGLAAERIGVPVIACGVAAQADDAVRAIREGAREYLPLPPDAELIAAMLQAVAGDRHAVVARDPAMLATLRRAEQIAGSEASVLITGESGTGKEVLARHMHARSRRAAGPFVALNCAAIPENLLESELFGHEKGAFSGAVARRIGKFEAAQHGTLLLDEISEMDFRLQAKLLRALQEREIDRVGGTAPVRIDVRILATTNRDMTAQVAAGKFREDLFFRLNVVSLRMPPLRERPGDIAALAAHFARRYAELNGVPLRALSDSGNGTTCRTSLARQRARAGEHAASRRAAGVQRRDRGGRDRVRRRRSGRAGPHRGPGRSGRPHRERGRARADPAHAAPHARQPHPRGRAARHLDPGAAQQAARLRGRGCGRRRASLGPAPPRRAGRRLTMAASTALAALGPQLLGLLPPATQARLRALVPGTDIGLALGMVALLSVLVLPLPGFVLDLGLSLSVTASVLVLMVALFLRRPLDFTSFPSLLLLTTLLRLSLNVATTRLILSRGQEGPTAAGHVVAAFGGFLMGGDVVIGLILFAILMVVNFMVITKGSGRIAEVAARFSLDAMPGKQMAIDAELQAGSLDERTARARRRELEEESAFYGAMDGAAKFVRGDAIAGLIITGINIVGGLGIGLLRHGMAFADAASTYTTLTVGDGLVSQIPALLVSTAAGIVVTKGGSEGSTDAALVRQLGAGPKPLAMAAGAATVLALMPGLPALPFLALAGLAGGGAWFRAKHPQIPLDDPTAPAASPPPSEPPIGETLRIDLIRLELGYGLLALAGGDAPRLTDQIKGLRRSLAAEMGFVLPPVRIQDNMQLGADAYVVRIKEIEAGAGELRPQRLLAMDPGGGVPDLEGERTTEPAFGLPALWIDPAQRDEATMRGCTVVDPPSVLSTHLTEIVRASMAELLSFAETQKLLDELPREQQKLVADLIPSQISVGGVQRVLQALLAERVSIRDLPTILEGMHEACAGPVRSVPALTAHVRTRLARQISDSVAGPGGVIPLVALSPEWVMAFLESLVGPPEDRQLAIAPTRLGEFLGRLRHVLDAASAGGETAVLLTGGQVRFHVRAVVDRVRPSTIVLAQSEIHPRAKIRTVGTL